MNDNYKDINFDLFDVEPDQKSSKEQEDKYINNFYENIGIKQDTVKRSSISGRRFSRKFVVLVAAIIMVLAFSAVVYATDMFGLRNVVVENDSLSSDGRTDISLQGYSGTPEYEGFVEWAEYVDSYSNDPNTKDLIDNSGKVDPVHSEYGCYNTEMADKLDEIATKYNLNLHGKMSIYDDYDEMMQVLNLKNLIGMDVESASGYAYEDGSFTFDCIPTYEEPKLEYEPDIYVNAYDPKEQSLEEIIEIYGKYEIASDKQFVWIQRDNTNGVVNYDNPVEIKSVDGKLVAVPYKGKYDLKKEREKNIEKSREIDEIQLDAAKGFQFIYAIKGSLDHAGLSISNINDYKEWTYKTKSGTVVNLAKSDEQALLILDLDNAFVTVNLLDYASYSNSELEEFVDKIDFSLLE